MTDPNRPVTGYPAPNLNGHPPPATAYPAPPPPYFPSATNNHPYYSQQNYYPDPYAPQRATFLRRFLGAMIFAVIITGTILFIIWLILRPRLPEFRLDSLSVSNFNLSSTYYLSGDFDARFTVRNPNKKMTLTFDDIEAELYYLDKALSRNNLPPFALSTKNETNLGAQLSVVKNYLDTEPGVTMNRERTREGNVGFNVWMLVRVGFRANAWRARNRYLKVFCGRLGVGIASNSSNGSLVGGPQQCRVGF